MIYVGMDISSKSFVVHAINDKKAVVFRGEVPPTTAGLTQLMRKLGQDTKLVAFEAGNQLKWIALWFKRRKGVHVHVVHPNEVKWITKSSGKTDQVDARKLAQLARGDLLPRAVHVVDGHIRQLRELFSARQTLQSKRVALINALRGYALQEGKRLPEKFFGRGDWYEALSKKRLSEQLHAVAEAFRQSIEVLKTSEAELTRRIVAIEDERVELLETIPGIGQLSSRVLLSAIDKAERFDNRKAVAKYGALTPTIHQSGNETHLGHINRDGRHEVRRVMLQCAHTVVRMKSHSATPLVDFFQRVMKRRGKKIAIVAVARKLLTIAYGVLKSRQTYDPVKLLGRPNPRRGRTYRIQTAPKAKATTHRPAIAKKPEVNRRRAWVIEAPADRAEANKGWQF